MSHAVPHDSPAQLFPEIPLFFLQDWEANVPGPAMCPTTSRAPEDTSCSKITVEGERKIKS